MITASLPMFTMRTFTEELPYTYTVMTIETNMKEDGKPLTHYQVNISDTSGSNYTLTGYSTQHHMDAFTHAKRRARKYIDKLFG